MKKVCATCKHDGVEPCNEPCISCRYGSDGIPTEWEDAKHNEPQTNADRIRATTNDRELANILLHLPLCQNKSDCERKGIKCSECLYEWLTEIAEGE